jgi:hypothetical protein
VRVDRAWPQAELLQPAAQRPEVVDLVPWEIHSDRRRRTRQAVDLGRVLELLEHVARAARLREHAESRAGT